MNGGGGTMRSINRYSDTSRGFSRPFFSIFPVCTVLKRRGKKGACFPSFLGSRHGDHVGLMFEVCQYTLQCFCRKPDALLISEVMGKLFKELGHVALGNHQYLMF